jgi:3-oxoacyl-[acyl-carrier protein] reductase
VVVTGGSRGIGLAVSKALVSAGYQVIVVARKAGPELTSILDTQPEAWSFMPWDLSRIETLRDLAHALRDVGSIYGLVNNAGIGTPGILSSMPDSQIQQIVQMNVLSPLTLTKYLVRPMMAARAGRIINMSSIVASTGYSGLAAYGASKASLIGFTRSLAREVGSLGITVNAVAPGFIETDMTHGLTEKHHQQIMRRSALQRMANTQDVAAAVEFLMSDKAANITGTVMTVDAGNSA